MTMNNEESEPRGHGLPIIPLRIRSAMLAGLFLLAVFYTSYFAAPIIVPIVGAVLLNFLLSPAVAAAVRWRIPRIVAASVLLGAFVAAAAGSLYWLADPAAGWLRTAPAIIAEVRDKLGDGPRTLTDARAASEAVEQAVDDLSGGGAATRTSQQVEISEPGLLRNIVSRMPAILGSFVLAMFLTFLLLASSDRFLRKLVSMGGTFAARRRIVIIARQMERQFAHYLGTVTAINLALGCIVGGAMYLIGLPNAPLWGVVAALLNFAPYIGPAITAIIIFLVGVSVYATLGQALLPATVFLVITTVEGQLVTPALLGRRLDLSPVVVFIAVVVLGWMWGAIGALMAVPVMATAKICLVNLPQTRSLGLLLGR
jgi:predicted PurR-regulated permease PerM